MDYKELITLLRTAETVEMIDERREEIAELMPEVRNMFDFDQKTKYQNYDLWTHCLYTVKNLPKDLNDDLVFLAALIHDIGKTYTQHQSTAKGIEEGEMSYEGHEEKGLEILNESVIPSLEKAGVSFTPEELERLRYYVGSHHLQPSWTMKKFMRKQLMLHPLNYLIGLCQLQLADCHAQKKYTLSQTRAQVCEYIIEKSDSDKFSNMVSGGFIF